ncbi:MAG: DNA polymerase III subunit delta' [Desulfobacteraceae bacterium]|nr:DNA polymerase III subunit delta' [Desulfobacteraceae bacterium]
MPGFASSGDQKRPVRLLTAALSSGNLPHALLFTGIEGIGKKTTAMAFAMACNCFNLHEGYQTKQPDAEITEPTHIEPCGQCRSCKKIISGNHPDIILLQPSGAMIKVDQIRALCSKLVLKPYEASKRFVIITDAQKLNLEAGNTLLKTLEEPPEHTVFILTALQAADILPTIVSRCQQIRFNPIPFHSLQTYIEKNHGLGASDASVIASMSQGSFTRAESMMKPTWINKRNWIIDELEALPTRSINLCLAFSEVLSKNKGWLLPAFEIMKNWFRDIVIYNYAPERIINKDLSAQINIAAKKTTINVLILKIKAIDKAEREINANSNIRLTLDSLMLTLSKG